MERGTVHVLSYRDKIRKVGMTIPDDSITHQKSLLTKIETDLRAKWSLILSTLSNFLFGHRAGHPLEHDFGDVTPTQLKSPIVVRRMWDQSATKYRYCGCLHVKVATWMGVILDLALITSYLVIISLVAINWENARALIDAEDQHTKHSVSTPMTIGTTTDNEDLIIARSQRYESYLASTIADASLAIISIVCLLFGISRNRPNFLIPQICLSFVVVGVKIIQLSKQASDGVATPFMISFGVVQIFYSIWFGHVVYLYRRYIKDRNAFLAVHTLY